MAQPSDLGAAAEHELLTLSTMWAVQEVFQRQVFPDWGHMGEARLAQLTRDLASHLVSEVIEVLRETDWKVHRRTNTLHPRSNMLEELVDVLKFWMATAQLHGFSVNDICVEFRRKSAVVEQRWHQEHELVIDPARAVVVDVDQTLADYIGGWAAFASAWWGLHPALVAADMQTMDLVSETARLVGVPVSDVVIAKHEFREGGHKRQLAVLPGAHELVAALRQRGAQILLLTARPYDTYKRVFADTMEWMQSNHMPFDAIWTAEDKREFLVRHLPVASMVIDDNPSEAERLAAAGYTVKVPAWHYNAAVRISGNLDRLPLVQLAGMVEDLGLPRPTGTPPSTRRPHVQREAAGVAQPGDAA